MATSEAKEAANIFFNYTPPSISFCISDLNNSFTYNTDSVFTTDDIVDWDSINERKYSLDNLFKVISNKPDDYPTLSKIGKRVLTEQLSNIISEILNFNVSALNIQPTFDDSVLFTFELTQINYYLEFFPNYKKEGVDEAVLTGFKDDNLVIDYSGHLKYAYKNVASQSQLIFDPKLSITTINASISDYITS